MRFGEKIKELLEKVQSLREDEEICRQNKLPENCWFLSEDEVVCFERNSGDSRYPYDRGGLGLWTHSNGGLRIFKGSLNIVLDSFLAGSSPNLCFYAGMKHENIYFPVSLTGAGKLPFEEKVERFTIFSPEAVYYFTVTGDWTSCVRMFVDEEETIRISVCLLNGNQETQTYVACYFNPLLRHTKSESYATKWSKSCRYTKDEGFLFRVVEGIFRSECRIYYANMIVSEREKQVFATTSYLDFAGNRQNAVNCALSLQKGKFEQGRRYTEFVDNAVAATIIPLKLQPGEIYEVSYSVAISDNDEAVAKTKATHCVNTEEIDTLICDAMRREGKDIPKMNFQTVSMDGVSDMCFNRFVRYVFRQVEFCARANYYAASYFMGVRDIFQQLEAALCWIPKYCRGKIIDALNFIGENGRPPRQYTYPEKVGQVPEMDLREFIDQGVWIISTIYTYLANTSDYTILDEECGYYRFEGRKAYYSEKRDSVLEHMCCIMNYLISNLDKETNCLHILYGDWNDALDGLGASLDNSAEFGSGVSVMATLQLYQNLREMKEIMTTLGRHEAAKQYEEIAERVASGLMEYAIDVNDNGRRKIIHGWGDKYSYKVGSWEDNDGQERDGLTSNAFWILSGMIDRDSSLKADVLRAYEKLDSKYGYKTFEPYFDMENKMVGRIPLLPRGTAENAASYIHATMFAVWSLFELGESELAWKQIEKVLPITHKKLTHSPFVMPNSYCYDEEKGFDGESMNDWFTGSACVLIKVLLWEVFGIKADLSGVTICPAKEMPFEQISLTLKIKGGTLSIMYKKEDVQRVFSVNGETVSAEFNKRKETTEIRLDNEVFTGNRIEVSILG